MTAGRDVARAGAIALVTLAALILGSTGVALAAPPSVTIEAPLNGSSTNEERPLFSGASSDSEDLIAVEIYAGSSATGTPVQTLASLVPPVLGTWSTEAQAPLPQGRYTALATQTNEASETGASEPVTFTVDTTPPAVTIASPAGGSSISGLSPALTGLAGTAEGDLPTITVALYAGTTVLGQTPLETLAVQASGASWLAAFGALSPGTYTAQAEQRDGAGNDGHSVPVTFTLTAPAQSSSSSTTQQSTSTSSTDELSSVVAETLNVTSPTAPLMQPFPVVRMAGSEYSFGVKVRLLTVRAPAGAMITVSCHGPGCPASAAHVVATSTSNGRAGLVTVTFGRFERSLRAGASLRIMVSEPGVIGKYTRFVIRHAKLPMRTDSCLSPSESQPIACPTS